ncbi:hypothetical protein PGT21_034533 [Puccinia graminis f. sp. tritici]|uniref:Carbohydrate-binding module family 19 domain-containing protein n=1 Tax=Puccinia graminis f. sp. tritici TaxID=56615 RepID=A0A5B0Q933_PUCGR|nr:hypothetical protein PGT21_034533 [Puccinia graminis f. sp. tritici]KAA1109464.1 hypothetical protein PGTUg99_034032 [Puccinia graminis f. sp. tritici]KAA1126406.1 hypothetical protein PGTUg99_031214 [Puccinia graminis f. sp. tritici]
MYHPTIPLVALIFLSQTYSRFIEPGLVPINPIHLQRRGIDQAILLKNGQEAQKLNAKFSGMSPNSPCKIGDSACISGGFSQCVGGKYVGEPCAGGLKCFAMPLLLKKGTSLGCDTEQDAISRIKNTGATGGLTGPGGDAGKLSAPNSTQTGANGDMNGTQSDSNEQDVDCTGSMADAAPGTDKSSTSMDSSVGSSNPSSASDSGTNDAKKSNHPMDSSSGAPDSSDASASGTDMNDAKKSTASSDPKSDSGKASGATMNSSSSSDVKEPSRKESGSKSAADKKNEAPVKGADNESVSFLKDGSVKKDCTGES